jgi:hypothetical protein
MSVFVLNEKSIASLADMLYYIVNYKSEFTRIYLTDEHKNTLKNECKKLFTPEQIAQLEQLNDGNYILYSEKSFYEILYKLNIESYNSRYAKNAQVEKSEFFPSFPAHYPKWERDIYKNQMNIQPKSRYQLLKTLTCYLYQIEIESDLVPILEHIENRLKDLIINGLEDYNAAQWN